VRMHVHVSCVYAHVYVQTNICQHEMNEMNVWIDTRSSCVVSVIVVLLCNGVLDAHGVGRYKTCFLFLFLCVRQILMKWHHVLCCTHVVKYSAKQRVTKMEV
jgi:hypothetical protein